MGHYHKGRKLEYAAAAILRKRYPVVVRSAGSHGPFDLLCVGPAEVLLVQVKEGGQSLGKVKEELAALLTPDCVRIEIWERIKRQGWTVHIIKPDLSSSNL